MVVTTRGAVINPRSSGKREWCRAGLLLTALSSSDWGGHLQYLLTTMTRSFSSPHKTLFPFLLSAHRPHGFLI